LPDFLKDFKPRFPRVTIFNDLFSPLPAIDTKFFKRFFGSTPLLRLRGHHDPLCLVHLFFLPFPGPSSTRYRLAFTYPPPHAPLFSPQLALPFYPQASFLPWRAAAVPQTLGLPSFPLGFAFYEDFTSQLASLGFVRRRRSLYSPRLQKCCFFRGPCLTPPLTKRRLNGLKMQVTSLLPSRS